jgi:hypothetical protein
LGVEKGDLGEAGKREEASLVKPRRTRERRAGGRFSAHNTIMPVSLAGGKALGDKNRVREKNLFYFVIL